MMRSDSEPQRNQAQSQDVAIEGNFQVSGKGNTVDFSQTHVDLSQATLAQTQILQVAFDEIKTRPLIARSPYIGLRKFEVRDRDLFFGRDRLVSHFQNRLQHHFLLVLGASGSGKSSLIRADLIPRLTEQRGGGFRELIFTPDRDPFESFRASLVSAGYRQSATEFLSLGYPNGLIKASQTVKQADEEWLIFVDQFEELFTLCHDLQKRQHFIESLLQLVKAKLPKVDMVLAMRADFLDRLSAYPALRGILQRSELVTDLGDDELRLAIEQPAAHHGVVFEPGLVGEIIQDLKGRTEAGESERISLPLLQYTLKLLWESSGDLSDRILRTNIYRRIGGVRGALQRRVDDIYDSLSAEEQQAAKRIFLQLVDTTTADVGTTAVGKAVSHRAALGDFRDATVRKVLKQLIDASLLISDRPSPDSSSVVELAHETLIDSWDTLKSWIEESKPLIRLRNQLKEDANRWHDLHQQKSKQAEAELWQGTKLQRLLAQKQELQARFGDFRSEETAFIEASEALAEQEHRRAIRRLQRTVGGIGLSLIAVSGFAFLAATQWIRAEQGQIQALGRTSQAEFTLNRDILTPLITAIDAGTRLQNLPGFARPADLQAEIMTSLAQGMYWVRERNRLEGHTAPVEEVAFSPNGEVIATVSYDKTLRLWSSAGEPLAQISHNTPVHSADFSQDGQILASGDDDGVIRLLTADGAIIKTFPAHDDWISSVRFYPNLEQNPQYNLLASGSGDGHVKLWDFQGELKRIIPAHDQAVRDVDFHPEDNVLVTASEDDTLKLWDLEGNLKRPPLIGHSDWVRSVRFSPDGQWLASSDNSGFIRIWKATGEPVRQFSSSDGSAAYQLAFSPDSRYIAGALTNRTVEIWGVQGNVVEKLPGHSLLVKGVSFSPDGSVLASVSRDTTVKLWQINRSPRMKVLEPSTDEHNDDQKKIIGVSINPDGNRIAATRSDGQVALWNLDNPQNPTLKLLSGGSEGVGVSFSPEGDRLASADKDGTIRFWTSEGRTLNSITEAHEHSVDGLNFSPPQRNLLASGGGDGLVKLWDATSGSPIKVLGEHEERVNWVSFNHDGSRLASASNDGTVKIWDLESDPAPISFIGHEGRVWGVAFSPQGDAIATAGGDKLVRLWTNGGQPLGSLTGHSDSVTKVQFSPDGELIFSASSDHTIKVWKRDGSLLATLAGHIGVINDIRFRHVSILTLDSSEGDRGKVPTLVSGSSDGRVIVWNLENLTLDGLVNQGCAWLQDYLQTNLSAPTRLCKGVQTSQTAIGEQ
ncbi:WD40 repeat-containing protein [Leptolyngbya sp. PCC 7375]|nr:WD40 repeat-containing protein [Leptolyngbya sp. PCC 7375]